MKIKTPANTAETYDIESTLLDISDDMESKMQAVSNSATLLPQQILTTGEHPLYEARPLLWPVLVRPASVTIIGLFILAIAPQISLAFMDSVAELLSLNVILSVISWAGIVVSFAGLLGVLVRFLRWKRTAYTITNRRVLQQTGVLGKSYMDCSLSGIQNVYMDMTLFGRIFGFGTIRMATSGTAGIEIRWKNVKDPITVHRRLNEAIQRSIRVNQRSWDER